jgi:hypothetical protein
MTAGCVLLGRRHLVAHVAHALAQRGFARSGDLSIDLVEEGNQLVAQRLPFGRALAAVVVCGLGLLIRAGHGLYPKHLKSGPARGE